MDTITLMKTQVDRLDLHHCVQRHGSEVMISVGRCGTFVTWYVSYFTPWRQTRYGFDTSAFYTNIQGLRFYCNKPNDTLITYLLSWSFCNFRLWLLL